MYITEQRKDGLYSLQSKELSMFSPVENRILNMLSKRPTYPKDLAKHLGIHEQNVYYHIRRLYKAGTIRIVKKEEHGAYIANIYALSSPSFFTKFSDLELTRNIPMKEHAFLLPFIENSKTNMKIVIGSPDPHGPERARSRDAYYAIDLGIFLGTFLSKTEPVVSLDTEMHDHDLKNNLIIIGGPVVNRITKRINSELPVRFDEKKNIYSSLTKKIYESDDCGIIVKIVNPFNKERKILIIAGKRYSGTRAAILACIKRMDDISKGNKKKPSIEAKVVEGIDKDGDGIIDDVRILE